MTRPTWLFYRPAQKMSYLTPPLPHLIVQGVEAKNKKLIGTYSVDSETRESNQYYGALSRVFWLGGRVLSDLVLLISSGAVFEIQVIIVQGSIAPDQPTKRFGTATHFFSRVLGMVLGSPWIQTLWV